MPASNQLCTNIDIIAMVNGGQATWNGHGSLPATTYVVTWGDVAYWIQTVNPSAYVNNYVPTYSQILAQAIAIGSPSNLTITAGARTASGTFTGVSGVDGYYVQWYKNDIALGGEQTLAASATTVLSPTGYVAGDSGYYAICAYRGANRGNTVYSDYVFF
jgi:hypothetical protein